MNPGLRRESLPDAAWAIRPVVPADQAALLRINAENNPAVSPLDAADLAWLFGFAGLHLVAADARGAVFGYLLSFPSDGGYDDEEIRHLRGLVAGPFYYIAQVALASGQRGRGVGRGFYAAVAAAARSRGLPALCSDVNLDRPNPESLAFHQRLGFVRIGGGKMSRGPTVAFLKLELGVR